MKKREMGALVREAMLPRLPGFIEANAAALRWPIQNEMVHSFQLSNSADGSSFSLWACAQPAFLPPDGFDRRKELGLWNAAFDLAADPLSYDRYVFSEALERGLREPGSPAGTNRAAPNQRARAGNGETSRERG